MEKKEFALSKFQYSIWKGQKLHPGIPLYNNIFTFDIFGNIDADIFKESFRLLASKTTVFNLIIDESAENLPKQVIQDIEPIFDYIDISTDDNFNLNSWIVDKNKINFDLKLRSYYSALIKKSDQHYMWYINQHHIFTDVYSFQIIYSKLTAIYESKLAGVDIVLALLEDSNLFASLIEKDKTEKSIEYISQGNNARQSFSLYDHTYSNTKTTKSNRTLFSLDTHAVSYTHLTLPTILRV